MLHLIKRFFLGDFESNEERKKFALLGGLFGLIIGVYWLFRPVKDGVFFSIVGQAYQPYVKILSLFVMIPIVIIYSKLVDKFSRYQLICILSVGYAFATAFFAYLILHPTIGLNNLDASPYRILGWSWYLFVESFGSVMVALFWSFVSDTTCPDSARRGYSAIALGGQTGGVCGPLIAQQVKDLYGTGGTLFIAIAALFVLVAGVFYYLTHVSEKEMRSFESKKKPIEGAPKTGFMEGLRLLISRPYLLGIFGIITFYEIIITIFEFKFKVLASSQFVGEDLVAYFFTYAIYVNIVALGALMLGIGSLGRWLGVKKSLLLLPALMVVGVVVLNAYPVLPVAFLIMIICKGINFSLVQPTKEELYIPTSKESRYKAKAWIAMFGSRASKGIGSYINSFRELLGAEIFMWLSVTLSLGLVGIWVLAALFVGKLHAKAVKEERLIC